MPMGGMHMSEDNQLGSLLIARGLLTPEQLDAALREQERTQRSLGRVLIDQGLVSEPGLVSTLATQLGLDYVDVSDYPVDPTAAVLISDGLARRYQALPLGWEDDLLVVAMADPSNVFAVDDIRTITGADVKMVVSTRASITTAIDKYHRLDTDAESISAHIVNDDSKNVITVEDPVEYRLAGINQVQVNTKAGLTFAAALRSILRSDPDVVLVGEIRDRETATIAVQAALTGHLVLSTLHTNDAASTATRLVEMGVEPFLVASALDCIVAQRLARRLCPKCRQGYQPSAAELATAGWGEEDLADLPEIFRPVGCQACGKTGYHGGLALHEVLVVSEEVERLIVERGHSEDIKKVAIAQGMLSLRQAGLTQVLAGLTSVEEILRVVA